MSLTLASEQRRNITTPVVLATVVLALVLGAALYLNPHRQGELHVVRVSIFTPQITYAAPSRPVHVIGQKAQVEQDLYAIVTIRLKNDLHLPVFVDEVDGKYISARDEEMDCVAPAAAELSRLEDIFPQVKQLMPHPVVMGDTVAPRSSLEGQVLLHFSGLGQKDWDARRPSTVTLHFVHQGPLTAPLL